MDEVDALKHDEMGVDIDEKSIPKTTGDFGEIISMPHVTKNLLVISFAWVLQFTAFQAMSNLQSSLNTEGNVGVNSLAILYAFMVLSSLILPKLLITILGLKWTISICQATYLIYMLANIYPIGGLMYPAAILLGLGAAPLWIAENTYVTQLGNVRSYHTSVDASTEITKLIGIFFMIFQTSQIWGNLISYFVLRPDKPFNSSNVDFSQCGAEFSAAAVNLSGGQADVSDNTRYILIGIYIGAILLSMILLIALLDQRRKPTTETVKETLKGSGKLIMASIVHMKNIDQLLLILLTVWNGLEQSFINAQFTQGVITCTFGIENIGLVFICFGVCNAASSAIFGRAVQYINRRYVFLIAAALSVIVFGVILGWEPDPNQLFVPFILAALWGIADGIYLTQVSAVYGLVFKENLEAAYSNYRLWESIGFVVSYAYTPFIKVKDAIYFLITVLVLGMLGFFLVDMRHNNGELWTKMTGQLVEKDEDDDKDRTKSEHDVE